MTNLKQSDTTVLLVEDDDAIRSLVSMALDLKGYQCVCVASATDALQEMLKKMPDVILLDLGLPDMDGVELIERVRAWSSVPIIVVSARFDDADKIGALDAGADDYLVKPFSVEELLARVRVALRHKEEANKASQDAQRYENGDLVINYATNEVFVGDKEVHLTPMEYKLLCLLAQNTDKVLTHNFILKEIWGSSLAHDKASLRVFMATLRKKIEEDPANPRYIQTHVGVGYRMLRR